MPFSHWPDLSHMFTLSSQGMKGRDHLGWNCMGWGVPRGKSRWVLGWQSLSSL